LSDILEGKISHEPIVNNEDKMFLVFYLVHHFISLRKGITHDSDKHVHHMDHDKEARHPENELEQWFHSFSSQIEGSSI